MGLRDLCVHPYLDTSTSEMLAEFYVPALATSVSYDRGVGFFSSSWLRLAASGLAGLARNGGHARIIASPILAADDWRALQDGQDARENPKVRDALRRTLDELERSLEKDTLAAIAWMIADELLDFRLAIPTRALGGDFHDKFGIFVDAFGDSVAFHGSQNDSEHAFENYESIDVFCSWEARDETRVKNHARRFDKLWKGHDPNLKVYDLPSAIRDQIVRLRELVPRPYPKPNAPPGAPENVEDGLWSHQRDAIAAFMAKERGILEMATGTGKTRTALEIMAQLYRSDRIDSVVVSADGTDLLDQWYAQLLKARPQLSRAVAVLRHYHASHDREFFAASPRNKILLASRPALAPALRTLTREAQSRTLLIHDEVHRLGSPANRTALGGLSDAIRFRLGLSATPEREYDQAGNTFIEQHVGPVLMRFELADAIRASILAPFEYIPLTYEATEEDKQKLQDVYRRAAARKAAGQPMTQEEIWIELSKVHKLSLAKLPLFDAAVNARRELLDRCIIFVETKEYGDRVLELVHRYNHQFHTYYADEDADVLRRFALGDIRCLITCHRLSEGIDIRSIESVILFSSARARLETIQRIGRCLRIDPRQPRKRARVLDFIRVPPPPEEGDEPDADTTDQERQAWLESLSAVSPDTGS